MTPTSAPATPTPTPTSTSPATTPGPSTTPVPATPPPPIVVPPLRENKLSAVQPQLDDNHWSKEEKYDAETYLETAYKKHLGRHANK